MDAISDEYAPGVGWKAGLLGVEVMITGVERERMWRLSRWMAYPCFIGVRWGSSPPEGWGLHG